MYRYITIARNTRNTWATSMYIYIVAMQQIDPKGHMNTIDNVYVISPTYPFRSSFGGSNIITDTLYDDIEMTQKISPEDITKGITTYWNQEWSFNII